MTETENFPVARPESATIPLSLFRFPFSARIGGLVAQKHQAELLLFTKSKWNIAEALGGEGFGASLMGALILKSPESCDN